MATEGPSRSVAAPAASAASTGPLELQAVYTGELFTNLSGGRRTGTDYLGDLSIVLTIDLERALGLSGARLFVYSLANHGGDPSERIGDIQVTSNIEAPDTWKLYEAWYQQNVASDRLSILFGLYDLNSEFDVIESAGLFVNSSFGIGAEYSQTCRNGPSIFPTTALGARLEGRLARTVILRAAVLDGVAGDPTDPYGTHIMLSEEDGALISWEIDWRVGIRSQAGPSRRRIGRGHESLPYRGKFALGGWHYTARFEDVLAGPADRTLPLRGSHGFYALGEYRVLRDPTGGDQGLTVFGRIGWADPTVNRLVAYTGFGVVYQGLLPGRDEDRLGLGVAAAHNGGRFERARAIIDQPVEDAEVAIELTYRAQLSPWLAVQPDLQYVVNPGTEPELANAVVAAARFELSH